jgi:hypothetical protein
MIYIGVGYIIGAIVTMLIFRAFLVGTLRIDRSDPNDRPYMFLELSKDVKSVSDKSYVMLKVSNENYLSRK